MALNTLASYPLPDHAVGVSQPEVTPPVGYKQRAHSPAKLGGDVLRRMSRYENVTAARLCLQVGGQGRVYFLRMVISSHQPALL